MRIYFLFQKTHTHAQNFHQQIYSYKCKFFSIKKKKDRAFCFSTKKVLVQQFFKCKIYFKNSNKLIIFFFFFVATQVKIFFVAYFSGNKSIIFVLNDAGLVSLMETISYIQGYNQQGEKRRKGSLLCISLVQSLVHIYTKYIYIDTLQKVT